MGNERRKAICPKCGEASTVLDVIADKIEREGCGGCWNRPMPAAAAPTPASSDRDGNYLGPTMGKALQLQPTFTPGPIDRCIGLGYLEALDTDDGSHLVQITEAGEAFLQQIEEIRQEAQRGWRERAVVGGARCQGLTAARPSPQEARSGLSEIPVG